MRKWSGNGVIMKNGVIMRKWRENEDMERDSHENRLEICQKFYTTGFLGQKFYTQKMRKWGLILLTIKQRKF